jgi:hypothetical protein
MNLVTEGLSGQALVLEGSNLWLSGLARAQVAGKIVEVTRATATTIEFTLPAVVAPTSGPLQVWWYVNNTWTKRAEIATFTIKVPPQ